MEILFLVFLLNFLVNKAFVVTDALFGRLLLKSAKCTEQNDINNCFQTGFHCPDRLMIWVHLETDGVLLGCCFDTRNGVWSVLRSQDGSDEALAFNDSGMRSLLWYQSSNCCPQVLLAPDPGVNAVSGLAGESLSGVIVVCVSGEAALMTRLSRSLPRLD